MGFFGGILLGVAFGVAFMLCIARYQITRNARRADLVCVFIHIDLIRFVSIIMKCMLTV